MTNFTTFYLGNKRGVERTEELGKVSGVAQSYINDQFLKA